MRSNARGSGRSRHAEDANCAVDARTRPRCPRLRRRAAISARAPPTSSARIEWPGKPGVAAPVPALTAEEQQRFDAGREVYRNICQQCHQPDGRGQERLAPSLVGSALALAAADIPARILLNGKEGPVGLMPPVGSVLSDDQIAGVLTYIRREWGQTGTPVDAAQVSDRARADRVTHQAVDA